MTYRARMQFPERDSFWWNFMERARVCTINFAGRKKKKMYFLKRSPLRHGKWKLLDIMKNNSHVRARARECDTKPETDAKSGKFFPVPFPDKCERGKQASGANQKQKCFPFSPMSMKRALSDRIVREKKLFDDYFNISVRCISATD